MIRGLLFAAIFSGIVAFAFWLIFGLGRDSEDVLYARLVKRCSGDDSQAARLIDYERSRSSNLDRAELIRRALRRLDRDNR
jgi:hypothetical protein